MTRVRPLFLTLSIAAALLSAPAMVAAQATATPAATVAVVQVMARSLALREAPEGSASVVREVARGRLLEVVSQRDAWFELRVSKEATAWVRRERTDDGQWNIEPADEPGAPLIVTPDGVRAAALAPLLRPGEHPQSLVTLPAPEAGQVSAPAPNLPREALPIPDRWRLMQALGFKFPWYDPYHQNVLKGDLPIGV